MNASLHSYISSIDPQGMLSFDQKEQPIALGALNVLIGPNASGKSNFIDILRLVRSLPRDIQQAVREAGGPDAWFWKGWKQEDDEACLLLRVQIGEEFMYHHVGFSIQEEEAHDFWPLHEEIWSSGLAVYHSPYGGQTKIWRNNATEGEIFVPDQPGQSILAQLLSLRDYPAITLLSRLYSSLRIYASWNFGREALLRNWQSTNQRADQLNEDYSNLALVLNRMSAKPHSKQSVIEGLKELYEGFTNYEVEVNGAFVRIRFTEGNKYSIPATRLSDGTLRYLCLLAILYNPTPPPVVCIEEPELGLHPDIVAGLAKHLLAASERMQLIVTTHSDILVDALTWNPETIIVCENVDGATQMKRLDPEKMKVWLKDYGLGNLWTSGQIGGNRW